jgi:hypothetical protein
MCFEPFPDYKFTMMAEPTEYDPRTPNFMVARLKMAVLIP